MKLICCVDDSMGMAFNKRRLSQDRAVVEDIIRLIGPARLVTDDYTAELFESMNVNLVSMQNPLKNALPDDYVFVERTDPAVYADKVDFVCLYFWNRRYPSMVKFTLDLNGWTRSEMKEFTGHSHEISRCIYTR